MSGGFWGFGKKKEAPASAPEAAAAQDKNVFARLFGGLSKSSNKLVTGVTDVFTKKTLDQAALDALEDVLVASDMGASAAARIVAAISKERFNKEVSDEEMREALAAEIAAILKPREARLDLTQGKKPRIVLMIGVNGAGKTTTIGKIAHQLNNAGAKTIIGAGDTFRAAAIEQLEVWAKRANAGFVSRPQGADAAGVAFETVERAMKEGADVALIDTAGRLSNKTELMAELVKIVRVMRKLDDDAPHETLLVLDATVGQNALTQLESFRSAADITGLVMTKLDGTAKGGVLVAIAERHALPIHFVGVGETAEDLQPFDARAFARALVGLA